MPRWDWAWTRAVGCGWRRRRAPVGGRDALIGDRLGLGHDERRPAPLILGHEAGGAVLTGNAAAIWAAAPGAIGARPVPPSPDTDLSAPRPVSALAVDNAYDWPARTAQIDWPARGLSLALSASDCFRHLVAYTPPGAPYFCIEPLSHAPDAVNLERGCVQSGLQRLDPGETLHGTITLARL